MKIRFRTARLTGTTMPRGWVRNPIYVSAFLVVAGETVLFLSVPLLVYLAFIAVGVHLFVVRYEEPTLARRFGDEYEAYRRRVQRWVPRRPDSRRPNEGGSDERRR